MNDLEQSKLLVFLVIKVWHTVPIRSYDLNYDTQI